MDCPTGKCNNVAEISASTALYDKPLCRNTIPTSRQKFRQNSMSFVFRGYTYGQTATVAEIADTNRKTKNKHTEITGNAWQYPYHGDKHSCPQKLVPLLGVHTDVFHLI